MAALAPASEAAGPWTVERVLDAARTHDPGLRAAEARAAADHSRAGSGYWAISPRVTARAGVLRSDDPALLFSSKLRQGRFGATDFDLDQLNRPAAESMIELGITIEQPLFNGAAEVLSPFTASHLRRAVAGQRAAAVADRLLHAATRYVDALRAKHEVEADSLDLSAAVEAARSASERYRSGQVAELDTLRAATRRAQALSRWLDANAQLEVALARLSSIVGETVEAADVAEPQGSAPEVSGANQAGGTRGDLMAARAQAAALSLQSKQAALRLLPSINGRASFDHYRDADGTTFERRWTVGVFAELPLWDGAARLRGWNQAKADARAARNEAERLERETQTAVLEARSNLALAAAQTEAAVSGRAAAENAVSFALERYRSGLLPIGELLQTQSEAARARARLVEAEARSLLSRYRYLHALGALR